MEIVHPWLGVEMVKATASGRPYLPASHARLLRMWKLSLLYGCNGEGSGGHNDCVAIAHACRLCKSTDSSAAAPLRTCPLCLWTMHQVCAATLRTAAVASEEHGKFTARGQVPAKIANSLCAICSSFVAA